MAGEITVARENKANPINAQRLSYVERRALSLLRVSSSRYNDASKITVQSTPKGNWRLYYDGKDTGMTVGRRELNGEALDEAGMLDRRMR